MAKGTGYQHTDDDRARLLVKLNVREEDYVSRNFVGRLRQPEHSKRESKY